LARALRAGSLRASLPLHMPPSASPGPGAPLLRGLFSATVGLGAFLLFLVQFVLAKRLLPWFGGVPAVWTTCMLFFQVGLLVGYAYAHGAARHLTLRVQRWVHVGLLVAAAAGLALGVALAGLPLVPAEASKPTPDAPPVASLLLLLLQTVGLPFVVLSATGPLLQSWHARLLPGERPWRLYALSNAGSLLGLLAYPLAVERWTTVTEQGWLWSGAFVVFALLCGLVAVVAGRAPEAVQPPDGEGDTSEATSVSVVIHWAALAMVASVLLLATTSQICQEVAVVPMLWMLPLALYLGSFIVCFEWEGAYRRWLWLPLVALGAVASTWALFQGAWLRIVVQIAIHSGTLFVYCMACHGELYRMRPSERRLTAFYLSIAGGGALGGVFSAVLAPLLFPGYWELHWAIIEGAALFVVLLLQDGPLRLRAGGVWRTTGRFVLVAACLVLTAALVLQAGRPLAGASFVERTFFGVLRVTRELEGPSGASLKLRHGRITHGLQLDDPARRLEPTTYYGFESGVGLAISGHPRRNNLSRGGDHDLRVAVVGLGVGTLASHTKPGDFMRFYEIDDAVIGLSQGDSPVFTYLAEATARIEIARGDARLSLEREPPGRFDVIAVDAFSSDSIPTHLVTVEALRVYARHLRDHEGIVALHVSNRYLDLEPVVAALEKETGWNGILVESDGDQDVIWKSDWALLSRDALLLTQPPFAEAGRPLMLPLSRPWTDGRSDLLSIVRW
jgi:hypothetical protein